MPGGEPTYKLLPHSISLSEVICPEDEGVDDTEERDHVRDVICGLQLVHDHTEAILLRLHALEWWENKRGEGNQPQGH